jgi:chromosome segregation protein
MQMNRLRLLGFKSFVEPAELLIENGLTGVVGPNGCGKSNLLEALRWVMGETSHKSMRAAAMDDVIFSGTVNRPARNSAEVTIVLDNRRRTAPAEFNSCDTIEITRRIEREAGSAYRLNGKEVRARDVKIMFEDAATGARSPALVRQGQIGEIVNAKPEQRRRILEDAAGVAGLHSRRHEAELRLKAAENNLARLADILVQLNTQIESLKRQARQAKRYKELSGEIRKTEALLFHLQWRQAQARVDAEEAALTQVLSQLALATEAEAQSLRHEAEKAQSIPALREGEAKLAASVARLKIEQENFDREVERAAGRRRELESRAAQLAADLQRERSSIAEAREILHRLEVEAAALSEAGQCAAQAETAIRARLAEAQEVLTSAEQRLSDVTARTFEIRALRKSLEAGRNERQEQALKLERHIAALEGQARRVATGAPDAVRLAEIQGRCEQLAHELADIEAQAHSAEERTRITAVAAKAKREASQAADLAAGQLTTELSTLAKLLMPAVGTGFPPVVDQLQVARGYEAALGAALGDDLDAPVATDAPAHWRLVGLAAGDACLPAGAEPLLDKVEGPPQLTRRLRQIGVVPRAEGAKLQPALRPGQRLVSREGDLWRWDGFVAAAEAPTAAAQRLAERNRFSEIESKAATARAAAQAAAAEARHAADVHRQAEQEELRLRHRWRDCHGGLLRARESFAAIERAARETDNRLAAVEEAKASASDSLAEARMKIAEIEAAISLLPSTDDDEGLVAAARAETSARRQQVTELRAELAGLEHERRLRSERLAGARAEVQRWTTRSASAEQHIATLEARLSDTAAELAPLIDLPVQLERQRQGLLAELERAEGERRAAADRLATAENAKREAAQVLRAAQAAVTANREARARVEAKLEDARARRTEEARRIREVLGVAPDACLAAAEVRSDAALPDLSEVERHLTRLKSDRERLGGVNLQAEDELQTLLVQVQSLGKERTDVEEAIAKLRGGIGQLNREAGKRLQHAFDTVDGHFRKLFATLFGGGEARLEMIESEDPLEGGGLEIIARPPGKKPATLSLLSGGEQTLTALSLIFAVFLTNPSPICVLDEVDAPLDDSNVDRFCTLMEKMADETETRFLVITHHPMTMARMDRLFGVTMAEKGVSQLVSVDLATAERYRDAKVA